MTTFTMNCSCGTVWHLFSVAQLESTTLPLNCGWASRLCSAPVGPATLHHNKHVYHSIQELHLWNLHCHRNCLEGRYLVLLHNLAHRRFSRCYASRCAPGNGLGHFHCFFHHLWYGDVDYLLTGPLTDSLMWDQRHYRDDLFQDRQRQKHIDDLFDESLWDTLLAQER